MANRKRSKQMEKHLKNKTKIFQPRRMTSEVERTFQESAPKSFWNHWWAFQKPINSKLDVQIEHFAEQELDTLLKRIKSKKPAGLDEIPPEVWKTKRFYYILLRLCHAVYKQKNRGMNKRQHHSLPQESDLGIIKNSRSITLSAIAAKVYNALLFNHIRPEVKRFLRKYQTFRRNRYTTSQIIIIHRINEEVGVKKLEATPFFLEISLTFYSIRRGKM